MYLSCRTFASSSANDAATYAARLPSCLAACLLRPWRMMLRRLLLDCRFVYSAEEPRIRSALEFCFGLQCRASPRLAPAPLAGRRRAREERAAPLSERALALRTTQRASSAFVVARQRDFAATNERALSERRVASLARSSSLARAPSLARASACSSTDAARLSRVRRRKLTRRR